jgi:hypothetical protein
MALQHLDKPLPHHTRSAQNSYRKFAAHMLKTSLKTNSKTSSKTNLKTAFFRTHSKPLDNQLNNQLPAREKYLGFYNTLLPGISGEALLFRVPHSRETAKCRNGSHFGASVIRHPVATVPLSFRR